MNDTSTRPSQPRLSDTYPWLMLGRSFGLATAIHVMILAAVGALATTAGWRIAARLLPEKYLAAHPDVELDRKYFSTWPGSRIEPLCPLGGSAAFPGLWERTGMPPDDPVRAVPYRMTMPFLRFLDLGYRGRSVMFYSAGLAWMLLVWSFFGTAICRMAAMKFTRDERVELADAIRFARSKKWSSLGAYLVPLVGLLALAVPVAILGLIMKWNLGVIVASIVWVLVVIFSFLMVLMMIGLILGWPLMWGAVATEGTDAFDAVSRAFAYTYQRPFQYVWYLLVASIVGTLGWLALWGISEGMISLASWSASLGAGRERVAEILALADQPRTPETNVSLWIGSHVINFWYHTIRMFATAYAFSYFFTAMTGVYLLLRRDVDATQLDAIATDASLAFHDGLARVDPFSRHETAAPPASQGEAAAVGS